VVVTQQQWEKIYTAGMPTTTSSVARFLALVLALVIFMTLVTPARAEADALAIAGIVTLVIAGVIIVVYLIAAAGSDRGSDARLPHTEPVWLVAIAEAP
jgi:hypothetical protein